MTEGPGDATRLRYREVALNFLGACAHVPEGEEIFADADVQAAVVEVQSVWGPELIVLEAAICALTARRRVERLLEQLPDSDVVLPTLPEYVADLEEDGVDQRLSATCVALLNELGRGADHDSFQAAADAALAVREAFQGSAITWFAQMYAHAVATVFAAVPGAKVAAVVSDWGEALLANVED